jgi:FKBP-type peptidyl-prolyl cis-trans isomerase FkpA
MKKAYIASAVFSAMLVTACGSESASSDDANVEEQNTSAVTLTTESEKQDYALGASIGMYVVSRLEQQKELGLEGNQELVVAGFEEALADNSQFTMEEIRVLATASENALQAAAQQKQAEAGNANLIAGQTFLAANAEKEGVMVTESGLQYEVVVQGEGNSPTAADTVTVHYRGTLIDGTEFDSSYSRGEPATFGLNQVIPGWTEGVQLMTEGSTYRFYIPSELAYGPRQTGQLIMPNSALIFDVELLSIESPVTE